ncbi:hypothetical protein CVT26_007110 [Gymnopilus dilepis]|uniref:Protein kinase domain-containing protein n=1 Tax=Gymnopilus dilepis TaxID=231916 RepID=A0A409WTG6_9AGAR|nr:hypothetical protein CVT26_007110 [Gymnopilus dilepis]
MVILKSEREIVPETPPPQFKVTMGDTIGQFTLTSPIAGGTSGEVWKARDRKGAEIVAVKFITRSNDGTSTKRATLVANLIKEFASESIRFLCLPQQTAVFKGYECIISDLMALDRALQLDRMASTVWTILYVNTPLNSKCTPSDCLSSTGKDLHALCVIHGDIKPENILLVSKSTVEIRVLNSDGEFESKEVLRSPEVKIADLDDCKLPRQKDYSPMGTPGYIAPEIMEDAETEVTDKADVFALGCLAYELHTSHMLFPEQKAAFQVIGEDEQPPPLEPSAKWARITDPDTLAFVKRAVTPKEKKRPNADQLLKHKYFSDLANVERD